MKHSTGKPTKAEAARMAALKTLGCMACRQRKYRLEAVGGFEVHHLLSGNRRRGHLFTVPLCVWHHRGQHGPLWTAKFSEEMLGPSLARTSKKFRAAFGTDDELLAATNKLLGKSA